MNRRLIPGILAVILTVVVVFLPRFGNSGVEKVSQQGEISKFMRVKLSSSQQVLEGLVTEQFKLIRDGGQKMMLMSMAAEWQVIRGPVYEQDSAEFQDAAEQLVKMAQEKNIDGATLAYLRLTMTCINCHKHVRASKVTSNDQLPLEFKKSDDLLAMIPRRR